MKNIIITEPQIQVLKDLAGGKSLDLCIEPSNEFGKWKGCESFSGNIQTKSIYKLGQLGYIIFTFEHYLGIRFYRCQLSQLGRDFLRIEKC